MSTRNFTGYSLIELVVVMAIAGVLAAFMIPRLDLSGFQESGFFQQALATIRHGQKLAINSGCDVDVVINSSTCTLDWAGTPAGCPSAVITSAATGDANFCLAGSAAGSPSASITFDPIGRPDSQKTIAFGSRSIRVEAETGYTHEL